MTKRTEENRSGLKAPQARKDKVSMYKESVVSVWCADKTFKVWYTVSEVALARQ